MKKSIALILTFLAIFTCFAACKKEEVVVEGGAPVTDEGGKVVAVVATQENGYLLRGDGGNAVLVVTDAKGNSVKKDGEVVTKLEAIRDAYVVGNRIEMPDYALNIPDGWSNQKSFSDLQIKKDGVEDVIFISSLRDGKLAEIEENNAVFMKAFADNEKTTKTLTVAGEEAKFVAGFKTVKQTDPETKKEVSVGVYLGFITFSHQGVVYNCRFNSDRDLTGEFDNIVAILNTIDFVN